jgi:hydroxypyruvate isomerase
MLHVEKSRLVASMSWMFRGQSAADGYAAAAGLGFDAVEHSFPYEVDAAKIAALLSQNQLEMALMYSPCRYREGEKGYACVPGREQEFERGIITALEYAATVKCRLLGVLAGEIPPGHSPEPYIDTLVRNLQRAADAAADRGVEIILEPICSARIPTFALHTLAQGAGVLDRVDRKNISLCFDTFHVAMEGGSVTESFDRHQSRIGYFQIANTPGRNGPGEGDLDLSFIVRHVLSRGWRSWISCEYSFASQQESLPRVDWAGGFLGQITGLRR